MRIHVGEKVLGYLKITAIILALLPTGTALAQDNEQVTEISNEDLMYNLRKSITPRVTNDDKEPINIKHGAIKNIQLMRNEVKQKKGKDIDINVYDQAEDEDAFAVDELVHDAYEAAFSGQLEVATMLYRKALAVDNQNTNIQYSLATVYHKLNDLSQAKKYYNQVLSANPKYFKALNNLLGLLGQENPSKALQNLHELAKINPSYSPLQAQIGMILVNQGDYPTAEKHLRKAVMLDPNVPQYKYNLAVLYDRTKKDKLALQLYKSLSQDAYMGMDIPTSLENLNNRISRLTSRKIMAN